MSLAPFAGLAVAEPAKPRIVFLFADDLAWGAVGYNGNKDVITPNIDRLAKEGLIFTDEHCCDTVCTHSRYSLLTGHYSWRTSLKSGVLHAEGDWLIAKGRSTVASLLKKNGYDTAMIGKWHLQRKFPGTEGKRDGTKPISDGPNEHGFDDYFGIPASMNSGMLIFIENTRVVEAPSRWTRKKQIKDTFRFIPPYETERQGAGDIEVAPSFRDDICLKICADKAVADIASYAKSARAGKPFFIYLPSTSPHLPHCAAPEFVGKSPVGAYGDFMLETDYRVGQVLDALDQHGLAGKPLVIQSSDNGAENSYAKRFKQYQHASNGEFKGGKRDIFEGSHRVPFLMRWPGFIKAGRVCHLVDSSAGRYAVRPSRMPRHGHLHRATQKATQQADAGICIEARESPKRLEPQGILHDPAVPCDLVNKRSRECMGIEPTEGVVHTPRWF